VHAVPNSMQGWVDAAAQLSSMLCGLLTVLHGSRRLI
jgi:hypothetical protein